MYLVQPSFIKENKEAIVIDCRYDMSNPPVGPAAYAESHVKGAYYINLDEDMTSEIKAHGGRHPLKAMEAFAEKIGSFGIMHNSQVIIYDNGEMPMACRLWFMLKLIGIKAYIVEGGFDACKEVLEVSSEVPMIQPSQLKWSYNEDIICDIEAVKASMNKENSAIIDSRSKERYLGLEEPFDKIAGHIPTAINYFWKDTFRDGKVKDYGEIEALFLEMDKYDEIIVHCGSGITGCVNMFFMEEVGIKSKLYVGSYSDWVSYDDNDIIVKDNIKRKVK